MYGAEAFPEISAQLWFSITMTKMVGIAKLADAVGGTVVGAACAAVLNRPLANKTRAAVAMTVIDRNELSFKGIVQLLG